MIPGATPVQPDFVVALVEDANIVSAKRIEGIPALVVEVLSPPTAEYDLVTKREIYARAGIPEYRAARPVERDMLVHSEPDTREHTLSDGELVSPTLPFHASLATFLAGVSDRGWG